MIIPGDSRCTCNSANHCKGVRSTIIVGKNSETVDEHAWRAAGKRPGDQRLEPRLCRASGHRARRRDVSTSTLCTRKATGSLPKNVVTMLGLTAKTIAQRMQAMKEHFVAGWSGYPLIGSREQIVDGFKALEASGWMACCWQGHATRNEGGNSRIVAYPLLVQAGQR